jgi:hypothetical protein
MAPGSKTLPLKLWQQRHPPPCSGDCVLSAGPRDRAIDGSPNDPGSVTVVMGPGFRSDPNMHRAYKRPTQSADRSTATGVASAPNVLGKLLESSKSTPR